MNTIDDMDATAEALKAAGDDIAAARLDRVRRDRIRGAITQAAADAALHVAKRHLAELVEPKVVLAPESIFDMFAEHGITVTESEHLPGPRPLGQGFVIRQGDQMRGESPPALPIRETAYTHQSGEFDYEWWHVSDDPNRYEYRIPHTGMAVREEDLPTYGACYSFHCATCDAACADYSGHPAQVGAERRLADAWEHWKAKHRPDPGADVRSESSAFAHRTPVERDELTHYDRIVGEIWAWLNRHDAPWSPSDAKVADLARRIEDLTP